MRTRKEGFHEFHETRERVPWSDETRLVKNFPKERSPYGRIHIVYIIISAQFFNGRQQTRSSPTDSSAHVTASRDILQPCAPRVRTVSGSLCVLSVCSPPLQSPRASKNSWDFIHRAEIRRAGGAIPMVPIEHASDSRGQ